MKTFLILLILTVGYECRNVPMSTGPPFTHKNETINGKDVPQFVMITFDDAVTVTNYETYKKFHQFKNKHNECPIGVTFFLSHENTNYKLVNELHRRGNEIASHTITYLNLK
jgi:hypothetical protein